MRTGCGEVVFNDGIIVSPRGEVTFTVGGAVLSCIEVASIVVDVELTEREVI